MYSMALYWVLGTLMLAGWLAYIVLKRRKKVVAASTDEQGDEALGSLTSDDATELQALLTPEEFKFLYDLPEEKRVHYLVLKGWVRIHDSEITRVWRQFAELTRQWGDLRRRFWNMYEADVELFENCDDLIWIRKTLDENRDTSLSLEAYSEVKRMLGHVQAQRVAVGISPDRKRKMFRLLSRYPSSIGGEKFSMPKGYSWGFYRNGEVEPTRNHSIYVSYFDGNLLRTRLH